MGCFIATSLSYIFGTLLTANGNLVQLNIMAASGMVFNLLINSYLIPRYQAQGAAVSSLVTQFATALLQIYLAQRIFKFKVNTRLIQQLIIFIPGIILLALLSQYIFSNWFLGLTVFAASGIAYAFIIGLLHVKSIFHILKYG
jgi:O-antigen/teichoic acid export membrane protein